MINIDKIVEILQSANQPRSEFVNLMETFHNPYLVLIACILSLRTNGEGDEKEMKELEKLERQEKKEGKSKLDD